MNSQPKYHATSIGNEERALLAHLTGLSSAKLKFAEVCSGIVLRYFETIELSRAYFLEPVTLEKLEAQMQGSNDSKLIFFHNVDVGALTRREMNRAKSLWQQLFPYPFSLFDRVSIPNQKEVKLQPDFFLDSVKGLLEAFNKMEEKMGQTELTCVNFKRGEMQLPLLFHYVRKKRISIKVSPHLNQLVTLYATQALTPEKLFSFFGTQCGFIQLEFKQMEIGNNPIEAMTQTVLSSIDDPIRFIRPPAQETCSTEIRL